MKNILLTLIIIAGGLTSLGQDLLININAYETTELTQKGSSYNNFLNKTIVAPADKKFVVIEGLVNQNVESTIKIDDKEMIFEAGSKSYIPIGHIERGEIRFKTPSDLNLKYAVGFGYIFSVDKSITSGSLKMGDLPTTAISSIGQTAPVTAKPKMMKILSNSILDNFEAKDGLDAEKDIETDFKIIYTPYSGKFLKVEINVLAPENPTAKKNSSYNFHPDDFHLTAKDGTLYKCAAFIRDGNYDDPFAQSMNNNVRYSETEPKKLTLIFYFGTSTGDFNLFHKSVESGTITVK